jgi:methyl-accepting chemotaxis protein
MAATVNRRKWRNVFTHSSFQLRMVLANLLFLVTVLFVFYFVLISTFYHDVKMVDSLWIQYASAEVLVRLLDRGGIMIMVIIVISIGYHIVFSHRLCGPLVNMKHTFEALAKGDTTRNVYLRRKDFLKTEANTINQMLAAVRNRIMELQNSQAEIAALAHKLPHGPVENRLQERLKDHQKLLDQWVVNQPPAEASFLVTFPDTPDSESETQEKINPRC